MMTFGRWFAHIREMRGLSQAELARRTNVAQSTISTLEDDRHQPYRLTLIKLAGGLNVDLNTLNTPGAPIEQVIGS